MAYLGQEEKTGVFERFNVLARRATAGTAKAALTATVPTAGWTRWVPWAVGGAFVLFMFGVGGRRRR